MVNRHVGVLERADSIQAVLPLTGLHAYEVIHDRVVHAGTYGEVIACPEVVRTLTTDPDFVETTNAMAATGRYRLLEVTDRPPYFLGLLDDVVQLGVDEDGEPRGLVESTDPGVQNWTEGVYERFKQQATRVDLSEAEAGPDEPTAE